MKRQNKRHISICKGLELFDDLGNRNGRVRRWPHTGQGVEQGTLTPRPYGRSEVGNGKSANHGTHPPCRPTNSTVRNLGYPNSWYETHALTQWDRS